LLIITRVCLKNIQNRTIFHIFAFAYDRMNSFWIAYCIIYACVVNIFRYSTVHTLLRCQKIPTILNANFQWDFLLKLFYSMQSCRTFTIYTYLSTNCGPVEWSYTGMYIHTVCTYIMHTMMLHYHAVIVYQTILSFGTNHT
jgi:hypothetical protein